ncbi:DeoR/GlpR family DNA-binding transcription regulator [Mesorhizobium calcicola]|uniref:DeoR/GlpR family DNA-binding transcription regulator n=1 Tax=Mesorhizobium calcicola TaxID=1300310 RepID=A0ABW4WGC2_9HYPH
MLTKERQAHILKVLRRDHRVVAKVVSQELGLSEDTIRRDLRELASEGLLQRVHGGALPASPAMTDFAGRAQVSPQGKISIAGAAAGLIRSGQVVFLDGGTTAVQLARNLPPGLEATVVTHSPSVAVELVEHRGVEVELIGGRLFKHSVVAVGAVAMEAIARVRADIYFMGVTGIHPQLGLTTGNAEEAAIKRALSQQAAETVVLASREKLGAASPFQIARLEEVDSMVVEAGLPEELIDPYRRLGVTVIVA